MPKNVKISIRPANPNVELNSYSMIIVSVAEIEGDECTIVLDALGAHSLACKIREALSQLIDNIS